MAHGYRGPPLRGPVKELRPIRLLHGLVLGAREEPLRLTPTPLQGLAFEPDKMPARNSTRLVLNRTSRISSASAPSQWCSTTRVVRYYHSDIAAGLLGLALGMKTPRPGLH